MRTVLRLIVLAALAVAVVQYVLPAIRGGSSSQGTASAPPVTGESGAWDCVAAASAASENFAAATRAAVPGGGNERGFSTVVAQARTEIDDARARCGCGHVACGKASRALDALEELVNTYGDMLSGTGMANPATARERVEDLLAEARQAAGEG